MHPSEAVNAFLYLSAQESIPVTPQKLQQLVYCFYREYLKASGKKAFNESFVKGENGPFLESVNNRFRKFGENKITELWRNKDGSAELIDVRAKGFQSVKILLQVWRVYKKTPVNRVQELLTQKGSAWEKADIVLTDKDIQKESSSMQITR